MLVYTPDNEERGKVPLKATLVGPDQDLKMLGQASIGGNLVYVFFLRFISKNVVVYSVIADLKITNPIMYQQVSESAATAAAKYGTSVSRKQCGFPSRWESADGVACLFTEEFDWR